MNSQHTYQITNENVIPILNTTIKVYPEKPTRIILNKIVFISKISKSEIEKNYITI